MPRGEKIARQFNEALITGKPATFYLEIATIEKVSKVPGTDHISNQIFVETLTNARCCAGKFFIVAFNPDTDFTVKPWLNVGTAPSIQAKASCSYDGGNKKAYGSKSEGQMEELVLSCGRVNNITANNMYFNGLKTKTTLSSFICLMHTG